MAQAAKAEVEVAYDCRPLEKDSAVTPMMRQYLETKALHPDAILFFRLGDFYEMFFEDAVKASGILHIALTSRSKGDDRIPMCGVPYHSARRYIAKLIEVGLKVAICEQMEPPGKGPKIVRREVTRLITPGMVLDEEVLEPSQNNFLLSVAFGEGVVGAALLDVSTGEFIALERASVEELAVEVSAKRPRELLVSEKDKQGSAVANLCSLLPQVPTLATLEDAAFATPRCNAYLKNHFQVASLEGFGLGGAGLAVCAAGAALRYVKETQKTDAAHIHRLLVQERGGHLILDEASCANLELLRTLRDNGRRGTLLGILDKTQTPMGARKLQRWLVQPLRSLPEIHARLDAVEELFCGQQLRERLKQSLSAMGDLERLCARLSLGTGNARDLLSLGKSLSLLGDLAQVLGHCQGVLLRGLSDPLEGLSDLAALLVRAIAEEPPLTLKEGGLIRAGYHAELDELVSLSTSGKARLLEIETRERERTGISSLKVRYNKVFGYYLEVTKPNLHLVPSDYTRKQTTVGAERYITEELKNYEDKVLSAEERRCALEYELFESLRNEVVRHAPAIRAAAEAVGTCDVLSSLALCASELGYVRPLVDDGSAIEIKGGRHPVVERMLDREPFVPNDVYLDTERAQLLMVTGPNMAGKSTVLRQVALTVLMAQSGSFVPAQSARVGLCDRVFVRVGASDNLAKGQSTFMVEMTETANILHHATGKSLVVLDEIGRGTSTFDGLSIAWAVAEHLHDRIRARALFATHYHELIALSEQKPRVKNCSIAVKEQNGKVVFLRKLMPGGTSRSYGIEVARLAGLPGQVVTRAREILRELESKQTEAVPPAVPIRLTEPAPPAPSEGEERVIRELRSISIDAMTPLDALNALARWRAALTLAGPGAKA